MKKWIISICVLALISGCSTTLTNPKPHPDKYTFQIIGVEIPSTESIAALSEVEEVINHPEATIIEYPIVIAGVGESVTNDQTKSVLFPEDYSIVDGKAVAKEKTEQMGYMVSIRFNEIKDGIISYHLNTYFKEFFGYDAYEAEKGISVEMPYFDSRSIDTDLSQKINTWTLLGGLYEENSDGNMVNQMFAVRIIPPSNKQ